METMYALWAIVKSKVVIWCAAGLGVLAALIFAYRKGVTEHADDVRKLMGERDLAESEARNTTRVLETVKETHNAVSALPPSVPAAKSVRTPAQQQAAAENEPVAIADADPHSAAGRLAGIARSNHQ